MLNLLNWIYGSISINTAYQIHEGSRLWDQLITLCNDDPKSGGEGSCSKVEVCLLNGYALQVCVKPRSRNYKKGDCLSFRIKVAELLIGAYRGRKRAGRKQNRDEDHQ